MIMYQIVINFDHLIDRIYWLLSLKREVENEHKNNNKKKQYGVAS